MDTQKLSNFEIEQNLLKFVLQERKLLHLILLHIKEVDQRKIFLDRGRSSLFEYLVTDLGYSNAAAQRRIEGARLIGELPEVAEKIKDGSLHLAHIGEAVRAMKQKERENDVKISSGEKLRLLEAIECKTISEAQHILSSKLDVQLKSREIKRVQKDESVHLQLTLSKEQYELFLECQSLAGTILLKENGQNLAQVIQHLSEFYLKKHKARPPISTTSTSVSEVKEKINRTLTPKTRREIRSLYRECQHKDPATQKKCGSKFLLEVDHKIPRWAGGTHERSNLTLLCAAHNKAKYRKEAGLS